MSQMTNTTTEPAAKELNAHASLWPAIDSSSRPMKSSRFIYDATAFVKAVKKKRE